MRQLQNPWPVIPTARRLRRRQARLQRKLLKALFSAKARLRQAELRASEADGRTEQTWSDLLGALNQFGTGKALIDTNGTIVFFNESCAELVGCSQAEALGKPWRQVLPISSDQQSSLERILSKAPGGDGGRTTVQWEDPRGARLVEINVSPDTEDAARRMLYFYDISNLRELSDKLHQQDHEKMIGATHSMRRLRGQIDQLALGDWTVLVEGETGAGKELVAHAVHESSSRRGGPFIAINCAGLSSSLLASQLFGHRRGAFTGAVETQMGYFEAATGGTLFLDEIGDVTEEVQTALLRVIEEQKVIRVGEASPRKVDARIIVATHRDLEKAVEAGRFRQDLFFRIRVARIKVPPLRERREDIPLLITHFLKELRKATGKLVTEFSRPAMDLLMSYHWPGNVRELKSAVDYSFIRTHASVVTINMLPPEIAGVETSMRYAASGATQPVPKPRSDDRPRIEEALRQVAGNCTHAARLLGMSRATIYRKIEQYGIDPKQYRT